MFGIPAANPYVALVKPTPSSNERLPASGNETGASASAATSGRAALNGADSPADLDSPEAAIYRQHIYKSIERCCEPLGLRVKDLEWMTDTAVDDRPSEFQATFEQELARNLAAQAAAVIGARASTVDRSGISGIVGRWLESVGFADVIHGMKWGLGALLVTSIWNQGAALLGWGIDWLGRSADADDAAPAQRFFRPYVVFEEFKA